jgi:crotonobetainyl-CoA:carnitine CoA-transferase CaiB-like acyl-CoA transferase
VLDLSRAVSGPLAGRILADLGADVVRAELPGTDVTQAFGKVTRGRSGLYSHVNAGKRSILLDLHQSGDVARLLDLAAACDVLVENFRSVVRMPYRFSGSASGPVRGVPEPGEHTDDILRDWTAPADLPAPRAGRAGRAANRCDVTPCRL